VGGEQIVRLLPSYISLTLTMIKIRPRFPPTHDSCRFRTFFCNNFQSTFNTCTSPKHHTIHHSAHRSFENSLKYSPYQDIFSLKYIHFGYKVGLSFSGLALIFDRFCYRFSHFQNPHIRAPNTTPFITLHTGPWKTV